MNTAANTLVLAIDGGGTRCRIAAHDGKTVMVETGSANVSTEFDGAIRQILQGLETLAERMGCQVDMLTSAPAFVGLAGVTGPVIAERLHAALPFRRVRIEDDRVAAVRGVLGRRDGVLGHCGTGSFYAGQSGTEIRLSGGWGPILGDEASAQWVGKTALRLVLKTVDGRLSPSPLAERLLSDFGGAVGIVQFAGTARPSEFGALAPRVTEFARRGDAIAETIMTLGAEEIAGGLRHIGWRPGIPVCLTGGIGPCYLPYLSDDLRACLIEREGEPLDGAISLAQDLAMEIANERN